MCVIKYFKGIRLEGAGKTGKDILCLFDKTILTVDSERKNVTEGPSASF